MMLVTRVPIRIEVVRAANAARSVHPSNQCSAGWYGLTKWSTTQTLSNPSASICCQRSAISGHGVSWGVQMPKRSSSLLVVFLV